MIIRDPEIPQIDLSTIGSETATLIAKYQRLSGQNIPLLKDDKRVLARAIDYFKKVREGHSLTSSKNPTMSEGPGYYNGYLKVREQLPDLGLVKLVESMGENKAIKYEIDIFYKVLNKLKKEGTLRGVEDSEIEKVCAFFSKLGDITLGNIYILNQKNDDPDVS
jgi:hypothetical protein